MSEGLTDSQYIDALYSCMGPDDSEVRLRSAKIVTTRKEHDCFCPYCGWMHKISAGSRAARERALVDGIWSQSYTCLPCLERWYKICFASEYPDEPCPCRKGGCSIQTDQKLTRREPSDVENK